mmetsp:Transcript_49161/g.149168  ORF Transcript_49161/g.149168 Transcript_49161/m.149168 type:complete len:208 (+) Transcript_49161:351-974(+)
MTSSTSSRAWLSATASRCSSAAPRAVASSTAACRRTRSAWSRPPTRLASASRVASGSRAAPSPTFLYAGPPSTSSASRSSTSWPSVLIARGCPSSQCSTTRSGASRRALIASWRSCWRSRSRPPARRTSPASRARACARSSWPLRKWTAHTLSNGRRITRQHRTSSTAARTSRSQSSKPASRKGSPSVASLPWRTGCRTACQRQSVP